MVSDIIFLKYTIYMINNLCEFGSGTLIKFQFVVHFKSANGNELLGVKGPPTN